MYPFEKFDRRAVLVERFSIDYNTPWSEEEISNEMKVLEQLHDEVGLNSFEVNNNQIHIYVSEYI